MSLVLKIKIPYVPVSRLVKTGVSVLLLLNLMGVWKAEAALSLDKVFTSGEPVPHDQFMAESHFDFRNKLDWEKRIFPETFSNLHVSKDLFPPAPSPRLHLKSPGVLPGIEFEFEMHSLQAFQSVVPSETFSKGLDHRQDQPLLVPPAVNAPDYNGGFFRFTW